jgi:hypothetical protein
LNPADTLQLCIDVALPITLVWLIYGMYRDSRNKESSLPDTLKIRHDARYGQARRDVLEMTERVAENMGRPITDKDALYTAAVILLTEARENKGGRVRTKEFHAI